MREGIHGDVGDEPQRYHVYNQNMKKGFSLIELLVTITIFATVVSIVIFFYIQSQRLIVKEQEKGYLEDMVAINLNKIREKILKADRILEIGEKKIRFQMKSGELDSIFEIDGNVVLGERRICTDGEDSIFFLWQDPSLDDEFFMDVLDSDGNGILEGNEMMNLIILYIRYRIIRKKSSAELNTSIYLRK